MKSGPILSLLTRAKAEKRKLLAVLVDPDSLDDEKLQNLVVEADKGGADLFFVGGSLLTRNALNHCVQLVKKHSLLPVVLFPGSVLQLSEQADALLFLSLISGRNPDLLIGNQVIAAPYLKQMHLEVMPTGYLLVESGKLTTAQYMSSSMPLPHCKPEIAACTAMAGEMLGLKLIYMDAGSGAQIPVSTDMIAAVRAAVDTPIIVGGGIRTPEKAVANCRAGADIIVIGNVTESNPSSISEIAEAIHHV